MNLINNDMDAIRLTHSYTKPDDPSEGDLWVKEDSQHSPTKPGLYFYDQALDEWVHVDDDGTVEGIMWNYDRYPYTLDGYIGHTHKNPVDIKELTNSPSLYGIYKAVLTMSKPNEFMVGDEVQVLRIPSEQELVSNNQIGLWNIGMNRLVGEVFTITDAGSIHNPVVRICAGYFLPKYILKKVYI